MTPEEQSALATEINAALRPATPGEPPVRPVPPSTAGLKPEAAQAALAKFQIDESAYGDYLMSLPSNQLTPEQRSDLGAAVSRALREAGIR